MPIITLPDGNNLDFPKKVTGLEVAEKILDEGLSVAGSSYTRDYYKYLEDDNGFIFNVDTIKREDLEELIVSYIWEYL